MFRSLIRAGSRAFATASPRQLKNAEARMKRLAKKKSTKHSPSPSTAITPLDDADSRSRLLATDEGNKALDVGPDSRPLFTYTPSLSDLTAKDCCNYMDFSPEELNRVLPEGLPVGMVKEFEVSLRNGLMIRQGFLDLRDNFRWIVDPPMYSQGKGSQQFQVLDVKFT